MWNISHRSSNKCYAFRVLLYLPVPLRLSPNLSKMLWHNVHLSNRKGKAQILSNILVIRQWNKHVYTRQTSHRGGLSDPLATSPLIELEPREKGGMLASWDAANAARLKSFRSTDGQIDYDLNVGLWFLVGNFGKNGRRALIFAPLRLFCQSASKDMLLVWER